MLMHDDVCQRVQSGRCPTVLNVQCTVTIFQPHSQSTDVSCINICANLLGHLIFLYMWIFLVFVSFSSYMVLF